MTDMKKLPLALTVLGLGAAASHAEIKINDNLSTSGFIDMSLNGVAPDGGDATLNASLDQFELDFMYKFGPVSARADVNATPSASFPGAPFADTSREATSSSVYLEQAFVTANLGPLAISGGRFLSSSGFEAAEPTGMYQYSYSKTLVYGYYQNGLNLSYTTPKFGIYGAVVSDLWNPQEFEILNSPGFEGQISVMPVEGVTAKAAYLFQMYDADVTGGEDNKSLLNVWAQYAKGAITVAGEFNMMTNWVGDKGGMGWLGMANYKITDLAAATIRYSGIQIEDGDADTEVTFSPSFLVSPNWLALAEAKYEIDAKNFAYALESTFSF